MTNQEVRGLSKVEILNLLCQQEEEIEKLNELNQELEHEIKILKLQIEQRNSLEEAAQNAIKSVQQTAKMSLEKTNILEAEKLLAAEKIIQDAESYAKKIRGEANRYNTAVSALVNERVKKMQTVFEWQKNQLNADFEKFNDMIKNLGLAEPPVP